MGHQRVESWLQALNNAYQTYRMSCYRYNHRANNLFYICTFMNIFLHSLYLFTYGVMSLNFTLNCTSQNVFCRYLFQLVSVSRGRARSEYRAIRICRYILLFSFDLCWVEAEHSHASPPTQTPIYMFYLCLCRLHWSSLPKLPILLFSLLLDGKPF